MAVSREAVIWTYRLLHDREPETEDVITSKMDTSSIQVLVREALMSEEFLEKNAVSLYELYVISTKPKDGN